MSVLMIGATERERIRDMIAQAKQNPVPLALVMRGAISQKGTVKLKDRDPALIRPPSQHITFPGGIRAAFSFEQQPGGLCSHLSISLSRPPKPGLMPNEHAVAAICTEFGVPFPPNRGWVEEYEPGEYAVNLVSFDSIAGHA